MLTMVEDGGCVGVEGGAAGQQMTKSIEAAEMAEKAGYVWLGSSGKGVTKGAQSRQDNGQASERVVRVGCVRCVCV